MASTRTETDAPGLDLGALAPFLAEHVGHLAGPLEATLIAGGRSNPTYDLTDGTRSWVLRRPPWGLVLETAHDMGRERRVISALADTAVPVPRVVAHSTDGHPLGVPFYVMEKVDGRTYRDHEDTRSLSEADRAGLSEAMVSCLVELHAVDPDAVGLGDFGRAAGYLERQLTRWRKQWDSARTRDLPAVAELIDRLGRSLPRHQGTGIVHGDFKIDNVMVRPEEPQRIVALLDWEMSTLGDPLADLGLLVSFWDRAGELWNPISAGATAHPGFLTPDEVVDRYAKLRGGARIDDLDWYVVFADLKIAVILEGIHARHRQGKTVGGGFDDVGAMVEPLLERALHRAGRSPVVGLRG